MPTIKYGTIEEFFNSALETAKEIDSSEKVTFKHTIWLAKSDLKNLDKHAIKSPKS